MSNFFGRTLNKVAKPRKPLEESNTLSRTPSTPTETSQQHLEKRRSRGANDSATKPSIGNTGGGSQVSNSTDLLQKPLYLCQPFIRTSLVKGNFRTIVALPKYIDDREWVAINLFDFFNNLNLIYNTLSEDCTSARCPTMSAGPNFSFAWSDDRQRNISLPAPQYIDYVMSWAGSLMSNESAFPTKASNTFGAQFPQTCNTVCQQFLRIFAHIYHAHYAILVDLSAEGHFNSLFSHFVSFCREFDLLDSRDLASSERSGCAAWVLDAYRSSTQMTPA